MGKKLSVLGGVKVHCTKQSRPEKLLTGVWVVMVARVVEVVDVLEKSWDVARLVENGDEYVLLAVCSGSVDGCGERGGEGRGKREQKER